jgi:hypothetical protein
MAIGLAVPYLDDVALENNGSFGTAFQTWFKTLTCRGALQSVKSLFSLKPKRSLQCAFFCEPNSRHS